MEATAHRFNVGDRVRVRQEQPGGNPRTPPYIRGKTGTVVTLHGVIDNPLDHRGHYPFLYTVRFQVREVFGPPGDGTLCLDVHEEWLDPA
jgi:nitrile hydratase